MNNPVTEKSVRFLAQSYTIAALVLYAVNEFILQRYFPSWISGKLSDFAWLFIAPVILTLLFSLMFQSKRTNTIPVLAYALTAIGFTAIKTIPAANTFLLQIWLMFFHRPAAAVMDSTDLLALLALPLSWKLWLKKETSHKSRVHQTTLLISFFALLTLADAPAPPPNVYALFLHENKVYAASGYYLYNSSDGGLTWESDDGNVFDYFDEQTENTQRIDIPDTQLAYRITDNGNIEKSKDNGESWGLLVEYKPIPVIDIYYYMVMKPDAERILITPGDMIYEPVSGNVIIANGQAGIGVITSSGEYIPVQVDDYAPLEKQTYYDMNVFGRLLGHYLFSAFFLMLILTNLWMFLSGEWVSTLLLFLSIIAWIFMVETSFNTYYNEIIFYFISIFLFVLQIFLAIAHIQYFNKTIKPHWKISLLFSFIGSLVFLTPYLLWYLSLIAISATWISYFAVLIWTVFVLWKYRQLYKDENNENKI